MSRLTSPATTSVRRKRKRPKSAFCASSGLVKVPRYHVPKSGSSKEHPRWSFPKDKSNNFLNHVQKRSKKLPGPGSYSMRSLWSTPVKTLVSGGFGSSAKRITPIDEISKNMKWVPGPSNYRNIKHVSSKRTLGGKQGKQIGGTFLDQCEFNGKHLPAPNKYELKHSLTQKRGFHFAMGL